MRSKSNGYVVWEGPSEIDGKPIVLILTGLKYPSHNPKTGDMVQSWILRSDIYPLDATKQNEDISICGNCPLRGDKNQGRTCYVNMMGVGKVYDSYKAGKYPLLTDIKLLKNKALRLGSYGDPAAVPYEVWAPLLKQTFMHTGYSHQWQICDQRFKEILMASVESIELANEASLAGWKYFRVKKAGAPIIKGEMVCPASSEAGYKLNCLQCGNCNGAGSNVVIDVHGTRSKNFNLLTI